MTSWATRSYTDEDFVNRPSLLFRNHTYTHRRSNYFANSSGIDDRYAILGLSKRDPDTSLRREISNDGRSTLALALPSHPWMRIRESTQGKTFWWKVGQKVRWLIFYRCDTASWCEGMFLGGACGHVASVGTRRPETGNAMGRATGCNAVAGQGVLQAGSRLLTA